MTSNRRVNYLDKEETENNDEILELDDDGYPLLPEDVMDLRLSRKKAILRQFMGAVRRKFVPVPTRCQVLNTK